MDETRRRAMTQQITEVKVLLDQVRREDDYLHDPSIHRVVVQLEAIVTRIEEALNAE